MMLENIVKVSETLGNRYDFLSHNATKCNYNCELIKNLCNISGGKRLPSGDYYTDTQTGFKYLQVADLSSDTINFENLKNIQEETFNKLKRYALNKHDIIISIAGTIGKICYVKDDITNVILTENCAKITIKKNIDLLPKYVAYILELPFAQKIINSSYIKTTIPKLGIDKIKAIKFPYPIDIETQKEIVSMMEDAYQQKASMEKHAKHLLNSIDNYVLGELEIDLPNYKKEKIFTTHISKLLNSRYDPQYNQNYFSEIYNTLQHQSAPLHSLLLKYKKGIEVGSSAYIEKGIPFIRVSDFNSFGLDFSNNLKYISIELANEKKDYKPKKGDILYSKDGSVGNSLFLTEDIDAIISGGIIRLQPNTLKINSQYLSIVLSLNIFKQLSNRNAIGTIIKHLNIEDLLSMPIPIPTAEKQEKIANHVNKIINTARQLKKDAQQLLENTKQKAEKIILEKSEHGRSI